MGLSGLSLRPSSPRGLTTAEAEHRLEQYGPNAIKAHEESPWHKLLQYFWGPIPWMIEVAAIISLARQDWADFSVILGLLVYNAAVGFWQDNKAASALAALKKSLAHQARVLRNGRWTVIEATDLVPGDIVSVNAGEILPADLVLTEGEYLSVDQAALTGESLPVTKQPGDTAYSGSIARRGTMTGVVTATGGSTFFGRTAKLVAGAGAKSHAERAVLKIGDFLILLAGVLAVILIGVRVYSDILVTHTWSLDAAGRIAQFVLVLLIASIPVAMPAVMSVTMALGALKLSKQKAILSRLSAISELAGVDVLCSDKTGTLTMNRLTLDEPISFGATPEEIITAAALATQKQSEDAIDQAVLRAMTITYDNGKEFAGHAQIAAKLGAQIYFAKPYHAWERGLNEHTNGLVRQYFPKGSDFSTLTPADVQRVEDKLNSRPRKVLGYKTPSEVFFAAA